MPIDHGQRSFSSIYSRLPMRTPRSLQDCTFYLLTVGIASELTISANLLTFIGDPYVSDGGSNITKLHPGTYLILGALCLEMISKGRPLETIWSLLINDRGACLFLISLTVCMAFAVMLTGSGSTIVLVDTFLPAGVFAILARTFGPDQRRVLRGCMEVCFAVNATISLIEGLLKAHLIPLYLNGEAYQSVVSEFRPTALYDHPLTGSALTMIGILLPRATGAGSSLRVPYLILLWTSLVAFGGRTAFLLTALISTVKYVLSLMTSVLARKRLTGTQITSLIAFFLSLPLTLILAWVTGLGTRLMGHLYWDASANVRVSQWQILSMLEPHQLFFGCRRDDLLALLRPLHLSSGVEVIENFWLLEFLSLGLIGFPFFVLGFVSLLISCTKRVGQKSIFLVVAVLIAATSSNSLGRKSNLLIVLVAALSTLAPSRREPRAKVS